MKLNPAVGFSLVKEENFYKSLIEIFPSSKPREFLVFIED